MSTVRVNDNIKKEVLPILDDLGISLSEAINMFLHQIKLNNGIPFNLKCPTFSDEMKEALKESEEIMKKPDAYPSFNSVEEFMEDLHNEIRDKKNQ